MAATIKRLDESVVNRIAAGEVIQRPVSALKELLENALDAKATSIIIVANQGGLKLLQITDNGTGIRREDLEIVCERFTTSKLQTFEDLSTISTFGFRGEALASISHVAKLTITTKTADEVCGFRCSYNDGKPLGKPIACAANQGTQITVEDLFYNVPIRQRTLKSGSEEFNRIVDVVSKYAIHNSGVSLSLKKQNEPTLYVRTQKEASVIDNVSAIFGQTIAKELVPVEKDDAKLKYQMKAYISNVNFNTRKFHFLLFINHRLVECSPLKKAIEMVYSAYLPRSTHPFVYMSLKIEPRNVDVNVHPTKHEVHFLRQEEIIETVQQCIDSKLMGSNSSRTFYTQAILPGPSASFSGAAAKFGSNDKAANDSPKVPPKSMVRTDSKAQKIDKFFAMSAGNTFQTESHGPSLDKTGSQQGSKTGPVVQVTEVQSGTSKGDDDPVTTDASIRPNVAELPPVKHGVSQDKQARTSNRREIKLYSVKKLRGAIDDALHEGLREIVANHSFVGCVDRRFVLLQHGTKLYLANAIKLSEEVFYQLMLRDFGNFGSIRLDPPASIRELATIALDSQMPGLTEADKIKKSEFADCVLKCLLERAEMLDDYFSMEIDDGGNLVTIPQLVDDYVPYLNGLPTFIMRLATEVNWEDEEKCFNSFSREVARFYALRDEDGSRHDASQHDTEDVDGDAWKKTIEHVVLGACRKALRPPTSFANDMTFCQVADLPDLYKVFERC